MFKFFMCAAVAGLMALAAPFAAQADGHADTLLVVTGDMITTDGSDAARTFDMAALQALPVTTFETSTIWTDGVHRFTGVSLADLMAELDVQSGVIKATAINDYTVEIPFSDAAPNGAIIAYMMDGAKMSVREKGPLWVIYPYDSDAAFRTEVIYSRSIWQLDRLEIVE